MSQGLTGRRPEMDLLKLAACLAVIAIHVSAMGVASPHVAGWAQSAAIAVNGLTYFAVPAFIFLSGTGLMLRYRGSPLKAADFYRRRTGAILLPYLGWSYTYYFVYAAAGYYALDLGNLLRVTFLGMGEYHLYFVVILFQLYLLFPLLKRALEAWTPLGFLGAVLVLHLAYTAAPPPWPYMDRFFMPYLVHFAAGMALGSRYELCSRVLTRFRALAAAGFALLAWAYVRSRFLPPPLYGATQLWHGYSLGTVLTGFAWAPGLQAASGSAVDLGWLKRASEATFYVYLGHPLLLALFFKLWNDAGLRPGLGVLVLSYGVVTVLSFLGALGYVCLKEWQRSKNRMIDKT